MDSALLTSIFILVTMVGMGALFGFFLALANKKMAVETDPRIHEVDDVLPKGQCGACGYAGCLAYAEAVVKNPDVAPNLCLPGKEAVALEVARITGKNPAPVEAKIATVRCAGSYSKAHRVFEYAGIKDCVSANLLQGGAKGCRYGCLGFGTCTEACQFGAMTMVDGIPKVNPERCTGCGKCAQVCPRSVIALYDTSLHVRVNCSSRDKGQVSRQNCTVSCIGCGICAKQCPYGAIKVENFLAIVDHKVCQEKCSDPVCLAKCPTKAITLAVLGVAPGHEEELDAAGGLATRHPL
jgi:RnfABCDGE-type electron transport complex B subunit